MMKVTTVSLNPAIDQTIWMDNLRINAVNRGRSIQFEAGGKGVNVALFLAEYARNSGAGLEITATGFLGRENARVFEQCFEAQGIADRFVRLPGLTRTSVKVVDEAVQQTTDINLPGLEPSGADIDQLLNTIDCLAKEPGWFVLTGSLPPGLPDNFYAAIIHRLHALGRKVLLDTSQAALREGARACPAMIKPNQVELGDLAGRECASQKDIIEAVRPLLEEGIEMVVVSMGESGALFATQETILHAYPPRVMVKSTVGAGDALVAGILCAQAQRFHLDDCARLATAFSLAAITRNKRGLPGLDTIQTLAGQVQVKRLNRSP